MPFIDMQQNQTTTTPSTANLAFGGNSPVAAAAKSTQATPVQTSPAQAATQTAASGVKEVRGPGFAQPTLPVQQTSNFDEKLTSSLEQFADINQEVSKQPQPAVPSQVLPPTLPPAAAMTPRPVAVAPAGLPTLPPVAAPMPPVTPLEQQTAATLESQVPDASEIPTPELSKKQYSLDEILAQAVKMDASDVHLNVGYRAYARKDGDLISMQSPVLDNEMLKQMLVKVVATREEVDLEKVHDLDVAYHLPDLGVRFRVNIYRERDNYAAAFRIIPTKIRTLAELNMPALIRQFTTLEQGLVLVTGATGSGKTTTIAAMLNEINQTQRKHIVTIEDPIEYIYPQGTSIISQRGMHEDAESWDQALKSILRQDPDVVLIGEMRDLETISSAMTIAETGHLVFATLHTNDAAQTMDRIIDVFPEHQQNQIRTQLANVLTAVISQKLVPINAGGGRRVAVELLISTSAVQSAIREAKVHQIDNIIQTSAEIGMISMEKSLVNMVRQGLISPEQAQQFANKPNDVIALLK